MIIEKKDEDEDAIQAAELEKQVSSLDASKRRASGSPLSSSFTQESIIYTSGLEASTKSAKSIAMFLVQS